MNDKKIIITFLLITVLIVGGGVWVLSKTASSPGIIISSSAKVLVENKTYDWGNIAFGGGNVSKSFTIKNIGTETLKLTNIKTSCTCTKAQVEIEGKVSPYFSMHSQSNWIGEVNAGKEAKLTVIFDPAFHGPSGVGPIERLVSVKTNDSSNQNLEFSLKGVVVK